MDSEPYAVQRDAEIEALAKQYHVQVEQRVSHTLYNLQAVIQVGKNQTIEGKKDNTRDRNFFFQKNNGSPPLTYQSYLKLAGSLGPPSKPIQAPDSLPQSSQLQNKADLVNVSYDIPTLEELGVKSEDLEECLFPGGETEGLKRLEKFICEKNAGWVSDKTTLVPILLLLSLAAGSAVQRKISVSGNTLHEDD